MTDPATVLADLHADIVMLDDLGKQLDEATQELDEAEQDWDRLYDLVAEELRDQYEERKRKTDPGEHTIKSTTRKRYPVEHANFRRAKRRVDHLEKQLSARGKLLSGRQSELGALKEGVKYEDYSPPALVTFGARRAA